MTTVRYALDWKSASPGMNADLGPNSPPCSRGWPSWRHCSPAAAGRSSMGTIGADGRYELRHRGTPDIPLASYAVAVLPP